MSPSHMWHGAGLTDRGLIRPTNQDALTVRDDLRLWMVADGMGGHAGGEIASRLAVESATKFIEAAVERPETTSAGQRAEEVLLHQAISSAHQTISTHAQDNPELKGMGTTIVILRTSPGPNPSLSLAHVGDSRAYRLREGRLMLLTRDHSLMEDYLDRGLVSPEEALTHPLRHVLTRALGLEGAAEPTLCSHPVAPGDVFLLCTDGLTKMMTDRQIADTLCRAGVPPETACRNLVDEALRHGGEDNVSVVVCETRTAEI